MNDRHCVHLLQIKRKNSDSRYGIVWLSSSWAHGFSSQIIYFLLANPALPRPQPGTRTSYDRLERIPPLSPPLQKTDSHVFGSFAAKPCDVRLCLSRGAANEVPALSTDLRLLKIQDWVNSGKDDKLMPLITEMRCNRCSCLQMSENARRWHAIRQSNGIKKKTCVMWLQHMLPRIWCMLENQHAVVSGHTVAQVRYNWTSQIKIRNTLGEGLGGLDVQNAVDYHLNAPGLFCSSVCLLCFSAAGLGLLSGAFLLKKGQKFLCFSPLPLFQGLQLWLFLDYSFVLARAQKKKVPFQKNSQLGDDVASEVREARSIESAAHMWECPQAGWCWLQRVCQHSCVVETAVIRFEFGLSFLFHQCCFISHSKSFFKL